VYVSLQSVGRTRDVDDAEKPLTFTGLFTFQLHQRGAPLFASASATFSTPMPQIRELSYHKAPLSFNLIPLTWKLV